MGTSHRNEIVESHDLKRDRYCPIPLPKGCTKFYFSLQYMRKSDPPLSLPTPEIISLKDLGGGSTSWVNMVCYLTLHFSDE